MALSMIEAGPGPSKGFGQIKVRSELRPKTNIHLDKTLPDAACCVTHGTGDIRYKSLAELTA
jgi:hypothetical protein